MFIPHPLDQTTFPTYSLKIKHQNSLSMICQQDLYYDQNKLINLSENTPKYNFTVVGVGTIEDISMVALITWWSVTITSVAINTYIVP